VSVVTGRMGYPHFAFNRCRCRRHHVHIGHGYGWNNSAGIRSERGPPRG
jgi:hypothetical protein